MSKQTYTIYSHQDGKAIGEITLTAEQFARYLRDADGEEKVCRLDNLPGKIDDLSVTMPGSTSVYLME